MDDALVGFLNVYAAYSGKFGGQVMGQLLNKIILLF